MSDDTRNGEIIEQEAAAPRQQAVARFMEPRIPYHPLIEERFGIDRAGWRALQDAIWPSARTADAIVLALSYCKARKLDPFKRPVHIVPIWSREQGRMVESVWPGIGELRTTAFRTGLYAGRDKPEYGPERDDVLDGVSIKFPEWCEITVYRLNKAGERMPYPGPRVYWLETYATRSRDSAAPNDMWRRRPYGQIEKSAEAAALRAAFPEEIGNEYTDDEMAGQIIDHAPATSPSESEAALLSKLDQFERKHGAQTPEAGSAAPRRPGTAERERIWSDAADASEDEVAQKHLIDAGNKAAKDGELPFTAWWESLHPNQRGLLGAKGRGKGPFYDEWLTKARKAGQQTSGPLNPSAPTIQTGNSAALDQALQNTQPPSISGSNAPSRGASPLWHEDNLEIDIPTMPGRSSRDSHTYATQLCGLIDDTPDLGTLDAFLAANAAGIRWLHDIGEGDEIDEAVSARETND